MRDLSGHKVVEQKNGRLIVVQHYTDNDVLFTIQEMFDYWDGGVNSILQTANKFKISRHKCNKLMNMFMREYVFNKPIEDVNMVIPKTFGHRYTDLISYE